MDAVISLALDLGNASEHKVFDSLLYVFMFVFQNGVLIHPDAGIKVNTRSSDKNFHCASSFLQYRKFLYSRKEGKAVKPSPKKGVKLCASHSYLCRLTLLPFYAVVST
jgi:hypothetical protein